MVFVVGSCQRRLDSHALLARAPHLLAVHYAVLVNIYGKGDDDQVCLQFHNLGIELALRVVSLSGEAQRGWA